MISANAVIKTSSIGDNTEIKDFVVIQQDVEIGKNVIIHPHVTIDSGTIIGNGVEVFPGAYIGKEPKGAGATVRKLNFAHKIIINDNCSIGPNSIIYYDVEIGNNTLIGDNASIREGVRIGEYCILSRGVTVNYNTHIGNRTKIMDLSHITGNCDIGDDVFISVLVATTNDRAIGKLGYEEERIQGPKIGNQVAIGAGANILPGVKIGDRSIIAAASLVNKDVPTGKMVAGSPARLLKTISE
ncbi:MAG: transferase [Richelia sp.]|nr:transferase [Richelia sp.]